MSLKPLHDRVVVRREDSEEKTEGGIIIPESAQEKPQKGIVVAVGSGSRSQNGEIIPLEVKVNDHIVFSKWSGTELKVKGEDLLVMKESDILLVMND